MFGGLTMPNLSSSSADCSNLFEQHHAAQETVYLLFVGANEKEFNPSWKEIKNNSSLSNRAFHKSTLIEGQIIVLGGAIYQNGKIVKRISLKDGLSLKVDEDDQLTVADFKSPNLLEDIYISSHATATTSAHPSLLYIYGGYQQTVAETSSPIVPCSSLLIIDVVKKLVLRQVGPDEFATAGHTMLFIDADTLLISGETKRALILFTSKLLVPDKCDLKDECQIDEDFVSPILWVLCEIKCQRWLHQICIGLKSVPKGKYICNDCRNENRPGKQKRKRKRAK